MPLSRLSTHLDDCSFNKSVCVRVCGFQGTRNQLKAHDCVEHLKGLNAALNANLEKEKSEHMETRLKMQKLEKELKKEKGEMKRYKLPTTCVELL